MTALIVDDEPIARQVLREELEAFEDFAIIGEAENGREALELISEKRPDVVFLDLQMPLMGGFEMIRNLQGSPLPVIVVVTAYDRFAIEAFEAGAIDYLLKPVSTGRLRQAVNRARLLRGSGGRVAENIAKLQEIASSPAARKSHRIVGKAGDEYYLLNSDEVLAFQAEGDIVWILTARKRYQGTQTLKTIQERLEGSSFQRIHRGAIVNVEHVRKMTALSSHRWLLTMSNGQEFVVSKRQASQVRQLLSW
jgi:two-component system, LytTR family, response regulator